MIDTSFKNNKEADKMIEVIERWANDVFLFSNDTLGMKPSEPVELTPC